MKKTITTPIYYVNDIPHIGHAYTTFIADMFKKYYELLGQEVIMITGTDEHGQKIQQSARKKNQSPKQYADLISKKFRDLWDNFQIDYDYFIRTTDKRHVIGVQRAFEFMYQKGDIYKGTYEGNYCVSCESFVTASQISNNKCPDCNRETSIIKEESYFFALSKYQDKLLQWYENNNCIFPAFRKNEVINFVKNGLSDLSITRTSFEWGIKIPESMGESKHIIYVWLDALMNYITALSYPQKDFKQDFWKHTIHIVGKDILRFHAVYWPAFLISLDLPLPKAIYVHGWWLVDGIKMSKSIGNVVNPQEIVDTFGRDHLRYFLMREVSFGQDGDFSKVALVNKINTDLANDLGNLLSRILAMAEKYFSLKLEIKDLQNEEIIIVERVLQGLEELMQEVKPSKYLEELWKIFILANGMITKYEPWNLMKNKEEEQVQSLLICICNILIKGALCLYPVMPNIANKILSVFSLDAHAKNYQKFIKEKFWQKKFILQKIDPLFPKIAPQEIYVQKIDEVSNKKDKNQIHKNLIDIEDFSKLEIRVGTIVQAQAIPKSKKLLKLQIDLGEEKNRQIVSGIAEFYNPLDLIQKQVCIISNLKPVKLMGELSEGMILAVKDKNGLGLVGVDSYRENGSKIS